MESKSPKIYIGLLALLMLPLCWPLLSEHLVNGHDAKAGLIRALYMHQYIGDGQFLVRWASNVNFGYGSPMFEFYPPFFYMVTVAFSKVTQHVLLSLNLVCAMFWFVSGLGMYFLAREFVGNKGGLLAAVAYVYNPYYIQDFYLRGAFAEQSTFALFPLLILSIYKLNQRIQRRYIVLGALTTTALSLAHTIGMFSLTMAAAYAILNILLNKNRRAFICTGIMLFVGWLMAAFFWLPALLEIKHLTFSFMTSMRYDYHKNFLSLVQLLRAPWEATTDLDGLTLQIGWAHLGLAVACIVALFRNSKKQSQMNAHFIFFGVIVVIACWLTLPYSQKVWEAIGLLGVLQFPWRFLTIAVFALSLFAAGAVGLFKSETAKSFFVGAAIILIVWGSFKFFYPNHFLEVDQQQMRNNFSNTVFLGEGERTPRWIQYPPLEQPVHKFEVIQGAGEFYDYQTDGSLKYMTKIFVSQPSVVCFHSFYFPGWRIWVDGKEASINPNNRYGVILFDVPPGEHSITAGFGSTGLHIVAMLISGVGVMLFIILMLKFKH